METYILYILKASVCLSIFLGVYLLFRGSTFHTFKRIYLLCGILASFMLPMIPLNNTILRSNMELASQNYLAEYANTTVYETTDWTFVVFSIFMLGILLRIGYTLLGLYKLYKIINKSNKIYLEGRIYLSSSKVKNAFSFGKYIFMPKNCFSDIERNIILNHEEIHVKQHHILDLIVGELMLTLQFFNPFAWFYKELQKENLEFIVDKALIENGTNIAIYQATLVNTCLEHQVFNLAQSFSYSNPIKRINMLKKGKSNPFRKLGLLLLVPTLGLFLWTTSCSESVETPRSLEVTTDPVTLKDNSGNILASNPLVLIDGKEGSLSDIDPNDVESVSVLKDRALTEKYGEKGNDGVIIVELKK